jgi:hypothetical protein
MEEYIYQGRIAICKPDEVGPYNKHKLSGVILAPAGQEIISDSGDWEGIQCEIIIRPLLRFGNPKQKGLRLDQVALTLGTDKQWEVPDKT